MEKTKFLDVKMFFEIFFLFIISILLISKVDAESYPFNGIIHADALVVHSTPDTKAASAVTELVYGTRITIIGEENNLYKINYDNGLVGYVSKSYITNINANTSTIDLVGVETYAIYCNTLKSIGFPESYCPYLYYLHGKHPSWTFKPDLIKGTLDAVSNGELSKNVLQTTNINYFLNPSSTPIEGSYYPVNAATIGSFIDPRNSLFESKIFQFLDLESSKTIGNDEALLKVTGANGYLRNFLPYFKNAASAYGVNPVHLIGRSQQEGANNSSVYSAVSGLYTTTYNRFSVQGYSLDGYYNFFNIGSYADSNYPYTVQRGLAYAAGFLEDNRCMTTLEDGKVIYETGKVYVENNVNVTCPELSHQRPWNNQERAINGGASFLFNNYTSMGQNTIFFEKFNISSNTKRNLYTNQYMTNIYAPASESTTMYNAYNVGGLINSNFNFIIPVYQNMSNTVAQAINKSSNNKLTSIKVNGVNITGFDSDVVEYNYNLTTNDTKFTITATAMDSKASISGTGTINFSNGVGVANIVVTAENGSKVTYKVNVKQIVISNPTVVIKASDVVSKMAVKITGGNMYGISPGTPVSTLVSTATKNGGTAIVTNSAGVSKTTGSLATGDKITIKGTSDSFTYVISIRGDINGDGLVKINDLILLQSHILGKTVLTSEKFYAADINYDGILKINDLILIQSNILGKANL